MFVLRQDCRTQLSGPGPRQPTQSNVGTNRSEKVQHALLFRGGRRCSRSEERRKGVVNEQVARGDLRYRSPAFQVATANMASAAGRSSINLVLALLCVALFGCMPND